MTQVKTHEPQLPVNGRRQHHGDRLLYLPGIVAGNLLPVLRVVLGCNTSTASVTSKNGMFDYVENRDWNRNENRKRMYNIWPFHWWFHMSIFTIDITKGCWTVSVFTIEIVSLIIITFEESCRNHRDFMQNLHSRTYSIGITMREVWRFLLRFLIS